MKIAFFSEAGYTGKINRNNSNIRTDSAWVCALEATHHPLVTLHQIPDNSYAFGVVIIPKNKDYLFEYPLVENLKRVCNKIGTMQESTYWYWQGGTVQAQLWYHNIIQNMDIIFCHNDMDLKYYRGITDVRCELMPTLMITDNIQTFEGKKTGVMVGGNWVTAYRGFDSYIIGKILSDEIHSPTTGRMKKDETLLDINHLPWVPWSQWMYELSKRKYGVQLGTAAAGTFNLNCAYLGIPCIAYNNVNTQKYLHPDLSVSDGDIESARKLATKLASDEVFYTHCSKIAKDNYSKLYSEQIFKNKLTKLINSL